MALFIGNRLLALCSLALALAPTLISSLILFVSLYVAAGASFLLHSSGSFLGLSYIVVYTGAVAVLFVFVVLLVENQHLNLAGSTLPGRRHSRLLTVGSFGYVRIKLTIPFLVLSLSSPLPLQEEVTAALGSLAYGEHGAVLVLAGWVLLTATVRPVLALCS